MVRPIRSRLHYGFVIAAISFVLLLVTSGMILSIGLFIKPISKEFSWDRSTLSLIIAGFMIVQGAISPFLGNYINKIGAKKLIVFGVIFQGLSYISLSLLQNLPQLFISYTVVMAVANGATALVAISVLLSVWFKKKRGLMIGITTAGSSLGPQIFTPLITYSILQLGWEFTFLLLGLFLLVVLLPLMMLLLKNKPEDIGLQAYGEEIDELVTSSNKINQDEQVVTFHNLLRDKQYYKISLAYFACGFTASFISTHYYSFGTDNGFDSMVIAFVLGLMGTSSVIGTALAGGLSDYFGRKSLLSGVLIFRAISFILLGFSQSLVAIYIGAIMYGLSWAATGPLTSALSAEIWGVKSMGKVFGSVFLIHQIGAGLGVFLGGYMYDLTGNYTTIFSLSIFILIIGAISSLTIREKQDELRNSAPILSS